MPERPLPISRRRFILGSAALLASTACGGEKSAPATSTSKPTLETPTSNAPATATSTTTPTETATPAVRGPEYGHASVEQMDGVPKEVQAKIKEILKNSNIDIIGNKVIVSREKGYESREDCINLGINTTSKCTELTDARLNTPRYQNALEIMDSVVPATVNLVNEAAGTTKPVFKAYDGNAEDETGVKSIKNIEVTDPNKLIILADLQANPKDIMFVTSQAFGRTYKIHKVGDWTLFYDGIYGADLLGNELDKTQYTQLAGQIAVSLGVTASEGFRASNIVPGGAPYSATQGESQSLSTRFVSKISSILRPDSGDSIFRTRGKYHFKTNSGSDFIHDNS